MFIVDVGYKECGWYKKLEGRAIGRCESLTVCDWCKECPFNPSKPIKAL